MKSLKYLTCAFLFLMVGTANAGIRATALIEVTNFTIQDSSGATLDANTHFAPGSLVYTSSADEDVFLDSETPSSAQLSNPQSLSNIDFPPLCLGDCPQIADNAFPLLTGATSTDFAAVDQYVNGAPIAGLGGFGSPGNFSNGGYVELSTGDNSGSANSNNEFSATWVFQLTSPLDGVTFSFNLRSYVEAYASAFEAAPGKASSSTTLSITLTDLATGIQIFRLTPAEANQVTAANAAGLPIVIQTAGIHTVGTATQTSVSATTPPLSNTTGYQLSIRQVANTDASRLDSPDIQIVKEVSVDGGSTFFDANDSASAPATSIGGGALYRFTVTNTGGSDLVNVVVNDATLGVVNYPVGDLAVGQTVVLTSGEIPELDQPGRCQDPGDVTNIATVDGQSAGTSTTVSDSDPAVVRCVEEAIDILKEVSVDAGVTFFDANDSASAPATTLGGGALYRITVTNVGTSDLTNVVVNDATLGIVNYPVGDLAAGETVVLTAGDIPELEQPGRCQTPGEVTNIASTNGQSVDTGNTVSDSDPAIVRCDEPAIEIVKEVSVDGGSTYFDANDSASAPATSIGGGALYRFTVTNIGTSDLTNVVVSDATLGVVNYPVGDLAIGETVVLTSGEIPELEQPGRCQDPGDVTNVATVDGTSVTTGTPVMDSDPAVVKCVEEAIDILKEVSVDGGVTFFDANDAASAPSTSVGGGALYRITVTNIGTSDLTNVLVNDATLGVVDYLVGDLAAGQTVVLTSGEIPALDQPARCETPGEVTNIATSDGQSVDTGNTVSDSDPAVVVCERQGGEGCTPGFWKNRTEFWPISTNTLYSDYFTCPAFEGSDGLLLDALRARGGGFNALARHSSAALLNALSLYVEYDLAAAEIVASVNAACASGDPSLVEALKNDLDDFNNQGCYVPERAKADRFLAAIAAASEGDAAENKGKAKGKGKGKAKGKRN